MRNVIATLTVWTTLCLELPCAHAQYQLACEPRADFVQRLRPLLANAHEVESALAAFSIVASEQADATWSVAVIRIEPSPSEPRVVRDRSCEALARAAALVVAAWMNGESAELPAAPVRAPASAPPPFSRAQPVRRARSSSGLALRVIGATGMDKNPSAGGSLEFFWLSSGKVVRLGGGFSLWPGHLAETATEVGGWHFAASERYMRPLLETHFQMALFWLGGAQLRVGPFVEVSLAASGKTTQGIHTIHGRVTPGAAMRLELGRAWALGTQVGAAFMTSEVALGGVLTVSLEVVLS